MTTETARLRLPVLTAAQAQKHVTHNEALVYLDTLVQASVADKDLTAPPMSPQEGDCYIVAGGGGTATGAWASWEKRIARFQDGQWISLPPGAGGGAGWLVWVQDEDAMYRFDGADWDLAGIEGPPGADGADGADGAPGPQGQGIQPDASGTLAERDAHDGAAQGFVYLRTDIVPFALYVKASAASGDWAGPSALGASNGRETLTANRTYYVRTDGSNSNDGLANTAGGAFLTLQKAWDSILKLDLGGFTATIQIADGTYTAGISSAVSPVGGTVTINGNPSTPANVVISTTSASCIYLRAPCLVTVNNLEVRTATSQSGIRASGGADITIGAGMRFGACAEAHMRSDAGGSIRGSGYSVVGAAGYHWLVIGGTVAFSSGTVTISGTPAFAVGWASAQSLGQIISFSMTYSGSATGTRYSAILNSVINTFGGGASHLPGNSAGSTATGGQYA